MSYFLIVLFFMLGVWTQPLSAGELREIELKDGTVISGEVISFSGGVYKLKSDSLGIIDINDSKVLGIRAIGQGAPAQQEPGSAEEIKALQNRMMNDQGIMNMILALQNDPAFQKILQDPAIMKAVNSGDINALTSNPKFMGLLNNSKVKDITRKSIE